MNKLTTIIGVSLVMMLFPLAEQAISQQVIDKSECQTHLATIYKTASKIGGLAPSSKYEIAIWLENYIESFGHVGCPQYLSPKELADITFLYEISTQYQVEYVRNRELDAQIYRDLVRQMPEQTTEYLRSVN